MLGDIIKSLSLRSSGFTLIEIMVVVAIIGLLATLALPHFMKARKQSHVSVFVNNMRIASDAFAMYSMHNSDYPADVNPGIVPNGMNEYLSKMKWDKPTVFGGNWDWDKGVFGITAGVSVTGNDISPADMLLVDAALDDGVINKGKFRQTAAHRYTYIME